MHQPRRTVSQMHTINYTRFLYGKDDLLKKNSEANRGGRPTAPFSLNPPLCGTQNLALLRRTRCTCRAGRQPATEAVNTRVADRVGRWGPLLRFCVASKKLPTCAQKSFSTKYMNGFKVPGDDDCMAPGHPEDRVTKADADRYRERRRETR